MDMFDFLESLWNANLHPSASVVANWASVLSLVLILLNTWRMSKISRFIEAEREKIDDIVQPFHLYCEIREAIQALQEHGPYELISAEQKSTILEGLVASKSCLELYFRQIHDLKGQRENIFLAAAHRYWDRKKPEKALEHFEKATEKAADDRELAECLYGLRACYALKGNHHACAIIDKRLNELQENPEEIAPSLYMKSGITMIFIYIRRFLPIRSVLPDTWEARFGLLRALTRRFQARRSAQSSSREHSSFDRNTEN